MNQHVDFPAHFHDRWDDQVALEEEMLTQGKRRAQSRIDRAKLKRDMTRIRPYRSLLKEWVEPVAEGLKEWIAKASVKRGVKPIALPRLQELDPETAAMVALKGILRMIAVEQRHVLAIAVEIGTWCEHEARCKKWMEEDPEDWKKTTAYYANRGSNAAHQRRSRIALFNKYVWEKIGWVEWTEIDRQRVGLELINIVITKTRRFYIAQDPTWVPKKGKGYGYMKRPYILEADEGLLAWLQAAMDNELVYAPVYMPTLIPPLPWTGPREGGYYTPFVKAPFMIRFKANHQDQRQNALEEYEALDMPDVYSALNTVQSTPWKINTKVLEVAQYFWDRDLAIAGIPNREEEHVPERPPHLTDEDKSNPEYAEWARRASGARTRNAQRVSTVMSFERTLNLATRFMDEPEFYFPHMLDFRGRMYPIPADLSPQGWDFHRGILTFSKGKPIDEADAQWLAIHLANTFGVDKVNFDDRIDWTIKRNDMWRAIAADPTGDRRWIGSDDDDNWQRLAAIFEWVRWLEEGEGMVSSLPIRVDGTCNGIQHLSAMVLDEVGGAAVNLLPGAKPNDIYQNVADLLTEELFHKMPERYADLWLQIFDGKAKRDVTKRPVMILPYGGTKNAYFKYTLEWLKKNDPEGIIMELERDDRNAAITYLTDLLWTAVSGTVTKAVEVMNWLKECAKQASKQGLPLWWRTPAGFYVRQFYAKMDEERVETLLDGQRIQLRTLTETKDLDQASQARGIAPNFVHSMDASALMMCVNIATERGVESFTAIHDAYGTVCADMWHLEASIRQAFINTYQEPVLENFLDACRQVAGPRCEFPPLPAFGSLNLEDVAGSLYFSPDTTTLQTIPSYLIIPYRLALHDNITHNTTTLFREAASFLRWSREAWQTPSPAASTATSSLWSPETAWLQWLTLSLMEPTTRSPPS
ncbi:hypothetical protein LZK73_21720 [Neorhizobium galegae]|nr:hypothetical protein LZK73_21720 [Neorhizobium galegae]